MTDDNVRFYTKKSLGQNFLNNQAIPRAMCDAANVTAGETIVEVGPGTGMLTRELLTRGARVITLEADERAIAILTETFPEAYANGTLAIHHADMRTFDLDTLSLPDQGYKVVANIPYYLTGMLFRTFLEYTAQPSRIVFLTQKEVARRVTTTAEYRGKESLLSLSVKLYGAPRYVQTVPRSHFTPQPKVDSAIVAVEDISRDAIADIDHDKFFELLHLGFGKKRKQLLGNLAAHYDRAQLTDIFSELGIPLTVRAEDLDQTTWLNLAAQIAQLPS